MMRSGAVEVKEIAEKQFFEALEARAIIELIQSANKPEIVTALNRSPASRAARLVHRLAVRDLTSTIAGAFAPGRPGDLHLQRAFELLADARTFADVAAEGDEQTLRQAQSIWRRCRDDHRRQAVKHARDRVVAHSGEVTKPLPKYDELFGLAAMVTETMETLARGAGVVTVSLESQLVPWRRWISAFWAPWDGNQTFGVTNA